MLLLFVVNTLHLVHKTLETSHQISRLGLWVRL